MKAVFESTHADELINIWVMPVDKTLFSLGGGGCFVLVFDSLSKDGTLVSPSCVSQSVSTVVLLVPKTMRRG